MLSSCFGHASFRDLFWHPPNNGKFTSGRRFLQDYYREHTGRVPRARQNIAATTPRSAHHQGLAVCGCWTSCSGVYALGASIRLIEVRARWV